ncbi:MAG: DUF1573 domain-containing protein, partial [Puniceicoccales bacterium]|nr:DUF1573 domain-containing protein [Puniceicoccales bacterium]
MAFLAVGGLIIYAVGPSHFLVPAGLYSKENGFDFGRIPVNGRVAQAEHRFEIFNNTGHEVIIEDIKVSCSSCIGAKLSNMVIGAKESQWLDVSITIPQTQFKKQAFEIYLVPREGEPLRMTVWGRAAFSQFASITEV